MAEPDQVLGELLTAAPVVEGERDRLGGVGRGRASAQDHLGPGVPELAQLRRDRRRVQRVLDGAARQDDRGGALALKEREVGQLTLRGAAGVAHDPEPFAARPSTGAADLRLDRGRHDPEEGVGDVVHQDADQVGGGGGQ